MAYAASTAPLAGFERDPVSSFYSGRGVLVTGATGFLGKVVLEKLLRQSPDVGTIFVLIRPRAKTARYPAKNAAERLAEMLAEGEPVWNRLEMCHPSFRRKLVAISGEIAAPGLGMSVADRSLVVRHCSVVIHLAATVNFTDHIQTAFSVNIGGTRSVLALCREIQAERGDAVLVHCSTCYVNSTRHGEDGGIAEELVPFAWNVHDVETLVAGWSRDEAEENTADLLAELGGWPNTYTLSKRMAEEVLRCEYSPTLDGFPMVIVRPSIIGAAIAEPYPGWIDTMLGPAGLYAACWHGVLHVMHGDPSGTMDFVPVDR
jgi:thioester reductase-like protein